MLTFDEISDEINNINEEIIKINQKRAVLGKLK